VHKQGLVRATFYRWYRLKKQKAEQAQRRKSENIQLGH
jgi:hypothetical protein